LTDEDGTHTDAGSFDVIVDNAAPSTPVDNDSVANQVTENVAIGTLVGITAASTDVGTLDTVTCRLTVTVFSTRTKRRCESWPIIFIRASMKVEKSRVSSPTGLPRTNATSHQRFLMRGTK
jgi:hypothetical protein